MKGACHGGSDRWGQGGPTRPPNAAPHPSATSPLPQRAAELKGGGSQGRRAAPQGAPAQRHARPLPGRCPQQRAGAPAGGRQGQDQADAAGPPRRGEGRGRGHGARPVCLGCCRCVLGLLPLFAAPVCRCLASLDVCTSLCWKSWMPATPAWRLGSTGAWMAGVMPAPNASVPASSPAKQSTCHTVYSRHAPLLLAADAPP